MPSSSNDYMEFCVEGQKCYISGHDLTIFYGLMGHRSAADSMKFHELPEHARIVKIYLVRKWAISGRRKELGGHPEICERSKK